MKKITQNNAGQMASKSMVFASSMFAYVLTLFMIKTNSIILDGQSMDQDV